MTQVKSRTARGAVGGLHTHRANGGRVVIDDTLVTEAVFAMTPDEILGDAADPEGFRIGEQAAQEIRRQLAGQPHSNGALSARRRAGSRDERGPGLRQSPIKPKPAAAPVDPTRR